MSKATSKVVEGKDKYKDYQPKCACGRPNSGVQVHVVQSQTTKDTDTIGVAQGQVQSQLQQQKQAQIQEQVQAQEQYQLQLQKQIQKQEQKQQQQQFQIQELENELNNHIGGGGRKRRCHRKRKC